MFNDQSNMKAQRAFWIAEMLVAKNAKPSRLIYYIRYCYFEQVQRQVICSKKNGLYGYILD